MKPPAPQPLAVAGPAGALEAVVEDPRPDVAPAAFAVICHPHPLQGGTMTNKVVTTLARAFNERGLPTMRFNFRGVGASAGTHDEGRGEVDDALAVVAAGRARWPDAATWIAGFSFGGVAALRASARITPPPAGLVTIAPALERYFSGAAEITVPPCPWLLVQGTADDVLDPRRVLELARGLPQPPAIVEMPDVGHFFHGKLNELRDAVLGWEPMR